jgi:UDP-glucuronate decarboxylase
MITSIKLDLTEQFSEKVEGCDFHYIIHAAGIASPQQYSRYPVETLDLSYLGTKNVLEMARHHPVESILCFSSAAVYGTPGPENTPTSEEYIGLVSSLSDRSSYAIGKKVLETLCYVYQNKYELPIKIVRPFNIYGPRMDKNNVIGKFIDKIMTNQPIVIYGDGMQTRTFCHIIDAINGFMRALLLGDTGEAYNIGSQKAEISIFDLAKLLFKVSERPYMLGSDIKLVEYPKNYPKNEPRRSAPNMTKANERIGYYGIHTLENGLSSLCANLQEN